jgi:hypothetical protein
MYFIIYISIGETKLIVQVCEHSLGGNDDVKGEVIIPLNSFSFRSEPTHTAWYALNNEVYLQEHILVLIMILQNNKHLHSP